ncbi:transposase [Moritella sp.]|uniref:IS66 family insertion sequence element accessory protein TnpA n=1 Tax=Moritella sp. TaxID=78556 RepID=UPI001DADFDF0|nr:transposase [Moritella sp.]MCJ8352375.1 transposase [Moritella sp.]NRA86461.1 transposase [Hyphomicrobiales bacterium]
MTKQPARRRFSADFKRNLVSEFYSSDLSNSAFSRRHDLNANMLFRWRQDPRYNINLSSSQFLPVEIVPEAVVNSEDVIDPGVAIEPSGLVGSINGFEISLPCGTQLRCEAGLFSEALSVLRGYK